MLQYLLIKNYALIQSLEIEPASQFNIVTGETGAGKSIMLGAVGLLLGNRADTKALLNKSEKCIIEARFNIEPYLLESFFEDEDLDYQPASIIRREISPAGKSRAFINDTPVNLDTLKRFGNYLVDIHSQHDNILLGHHQFQLDLVDNFAMHQELLKEYQILYQKYLETDGKYNNLQSTVQNLRNEEDFIRFQLEELTRADLKSHEQSSLESELKVLENAEDIKNKIFEILVLLDQSEINVNAQLLQVNSHLSQLSKISEQYEPLASRVNNAMIDLKDIVRDLERAQEVVDFNPERTNEVQDRLALIYRLQQKHHVSGIDELLKIQEMLENKVFKADHIETELNQALKEKEKIYGELTRCATDLSGSRKNVFNELSESMVDLLQQVGMPDATIAFQLSTIPPGNFGIDDIDMLFSANKGIAPQPLKKVASGGEFSRLLFCIKYILARKTSLPTLIFDEIDTGVSGEIAIKMAGMMKEMASHHQVIAISHLPQFAAKGDAHYYVFKDNSSTTAISKIKKLSPEERVEEIAKMIGGDTPTETAFENARELMSIN